MMPHISKTAFDSDGQAHRRGARGWRRLGLFGGTALLVIFLVVAVAAPVMAATPASFPDVPADHPYAGAINTLASLGVIGGYQNGYFGLNDFVKRAQFAKMTVGALGISPNASTSTRFQDLGTPDSNGYPHRWVQTAYDNGITYGTNAAQSLFAPYNNIRRDQMVSMVVRGADSIFPGVLADPPASFGGLFEGVPEPHGANLRKAEYNGLLDGLIGLDTWSVSANATRGEVAMVLFNLLIELPSSGVWVYEDGSGDYPTIEAAVANIAPGTTINLGPGEFPLQHTLIADFSFELVGNGMTGPDASVVTYPGTVLEVVEQANFSAADVSFVCTTGSLVQAGTDVVPLPKNKLSAAQTAAPAAVPGSDAVYVSDSTADFTRCGFFGGNFADPDYGSGLYLVGTASASASDCVFALNELDGVLAVEDADVYIYNSTIDSNGENGVGFFDSATGTVDQCDVTNNALHGVSCNDSSEVTVLNSDCSHNGAPGDIYASGIYAEEDAVCTVQNSSCDNNLIDGISSHDFAELTVTDSECNSNGEDGVTFSEKVIGSITNSECSDNVYDGIDIHDDAGVAVDSNVCFNNGRGGIFLDNFAEAALVNNECAGNYYGLYIGADVFVTFGPNNFFHDNFLNVADNRMIL